MTNYLFEIDDRIKRLQTEIARLTVARGVIEELQGDVKPKTVEERVNSKIVALANEIEDRSVIAETHPELVKPRYRVPVSHPKKGRNELMKEVLDVVGTVQPAASGRIIEFISPTIRGSARQPYYAALHQMLKDGTLLRDDEGLYRVRS